MKEIVLLTRNNSLYRDFFLDAGCAVVESDASSSPAGDDTDGPAERVAVLEIGDDSLDTAVEAVRRMRERGARVVCVASADTARVRGFLLGEGVADLLPAAQPRRLVESVMAMEEYVDDERGSFVVLDDRRERVRIMRSVAERFGYRLSAVVTLDDYFAAFGRDRAASFVNLGASGFEISAFVRRAHACGNMKLAPFIPYKDACDGIFVHELISGLNRLTKVILSPEEMLSFLVGMLFRKEIAVPLDDLALALGYPDCAGYARESFGKLCFSLGMGAFELANVLGDTHHARMRAAAARMQRALVKTDAVRWLVREPVKVPTCGARGA